MDTQYVCHNVHEILYDSLRISGCDGLVCGIMRVKRITLCALA